MQPIIIRQLPTPVPIRMAAPTIQANTDVSPMLPGISPTNEFHNDTPADSRLRETLSCKGVFAAIPRVLLMYRQRQRQLTIAGSKHRRINTRDTKNRQRLVQSTPDLKVFPVPPKTSFPTTMPNEMPNATCHNGIVGGNVSGNNNPVTKTLH